MQPLRFAATGLFLFAGVAQAATINVPTDQGTIQAAIDAASNGDTVVVAPGTYYEQIDFKGKAITVKSSGGAAVTILDGNNSGPIVSFVNDEGGASVLQGFTLTHALYTDSGRSAVWLDLASPTIEDNIFVDNVDAVGDGIISASSISGITSSAVIVRNYFIRNVGMSGEIIPHYSVVSLFGGSHVVADNVFVNNSAVAISEFTAGEAPQIYNNTMLGNAMGLGINQFGVSPFGMLFENNLIAFNQYGIGISKATDVQVPLSNNLVYGNTTANYIGITDQTGANGNVSANPRLRDWGDGDVNLLYGSPAIDAGDSTVTQLSAVDFYGHPRVTVGNPGGASVVDIGAVEYTPASATVDGSVTFRVYAGGTGMMGISGVDPTEPVTYQIVTPPSHGSLTISTKSAGGFKYIPGQGYLGSDSFQFDIVDPYGTSNTATENITVVDLPAKIANTSFTVLRTLPHRGSLIASKAYPQQVLHFTLGHAPQHGIAAVDNQTGAYTYKANKGFHGTDSFTAQVTDQFGTASTATVTVRVL